MKTSFEGQGKIPNTYIIGVQKAGTTSLHYWLSQHPDIFAPNALKDVDILANPARADKALQHFTKAFDGAAKEKVILHSQVNYIFFRNAIRNIHNLSKDAKLIVVLRNPIDRAFSAYNYFKELNKEKRSIEEALMYNPSMDNEHTNENANYSYLEHGLYYQQLKFLLSYFDRSSILILEFEELKSDPHVLLEKVYSFLGIETFEPNITPKNVTGTVRYQWLQTVLSHTSPKQRKFMKKYVDGWFSAEKRGALKRKVRDMNTNTRRKKGGSVLPSNVKRFLEDFYEEDIKNLEKILETSFIKWIK